MIPPLDIGGNWVVAIRRPEEQLVVFVLPNQDTYELDIQEAMSYLKLLKVSEENKFLDYVWNFGAGKLELDNMQLEPLTIEQAESFIKRPNAVTF